MQDELTLAIADLDEQTVLALVQERLNDGQDALAILGVCRQGMTLVGEYFQEGEYFISELIFSAAIFKQVAKMVEPHLSSATRPSRGTVVMGTVKGDIHDIGKDLVVVLLKAANFDVHDLGVDVPPQRFVEELKETGAPVLGLSALLTTAFPPMKAIVAAVEEAGLRSQVKIMIGGGPINEQVQQFVGADAWGANAQTAVDLCNQWIGDVPNA
ncbi:MAG: cobalamin-binding protein [Chloroflexi bacterium]|nr:cobalamin-binding protein [Chloroflexota bacterium]